MIPKIVIEDGAEKFALFETDDGSFFLRALCLPYHNRIMDKFEKDAWQHSLDVTDMGGAKFRVRDDAVVLYDFSAAWGYFPEKYKEQLIALFKEAFPHKEIINNLD